MKNPSNPWVSFSNIVTNSHSNSIQLNSQNWSILKNNTNQSTIEPAVSILINLANYITDSINKLTLTINSDKSPNSTTVPNSLSLSLSDNFEFIPYRP